MAPEFETQNLAKHCNETLILAILARGRRHGYQLALEVEQESAGFFRFNHGTLYPILHKLEKDGIISGKWTEEGPKRRRKQYALTAKGKRYLETRREAWQAFFRHFSSVLGDMEE